MSEKIILASASARRKTLLQELVRDFRVYHADIDESVKHGETPLSHTKRLAFEKALKAASVFKDGCIIGADTVVTLDNVIYGKPENAADARTMLSTLSNRTHTVITAFCVLNAKTGEKIEKAVESRVTIRPLSAKDIEDYIKTGEPFDKAGAYAVQGTGGVRFVEKVEGSYTNVVGLPMEALKKAFLEMHIHGDINSCAYRASEQSRPRRDECEE